MELMTDDNKKQFEKWYFKFLGLRNIDGTDEVFLKVFYGNKIEMQIGVLLSYYDSLELYIDTDYECQHEWGINYFDMEYIYGSHFKTRKLALIEAFKKANEIINNLSLKK